MSGRADLTAPPLLTFETYLSAMEAAAASSAPWRTESRTIAVLKTSSGHSTVDWKRHVSSSLPFSDSQTANGRGSGNSGIDRKPASTPRLWRNPFRSLR